MEEVHIDLVHYVQHYIPEGQAIAIRINKQLQKKEMTIKTKVQLLNDDCSIVPPLKFEDLKNVDGSAWTEILRESDDSTAIPMLIQNEAAEHYNMVCRAMEEIDLLSKEVRSVMLYYSAQHTLFVDLIPKLSGAGEKAAVIEEGLACEKEMMKFYDSMKDCVSCDINVPSFFTEFVHIGWNTGLDDIIREIENLDELTGHESSKSDESEISDIEDLSDENWKEFHKSATNSSFVKIVPVFCWYLIFTEVSTITSNLPFLLLSTVEWLFFPFNNFP